MVTPSRYVPTSRATYGQDSDSSYCDGSPALRPLSESARHRHSEPAGPSEGIQHSFRAGPP